MSPGEDLTYRRAFDSAHGHAPSPLSPLLAQPPGMPPASLLSEEPEEPQEACKGVEDILDLNDFSESSLLLTLQTRYQREEVYTFVGPILISINPYQWKRSLYDDACIIRYHSTDCVHLPPHLFKVQPPSLTGRW